MLNPLTQPRWLLAAEGAALLAGSAIAYGAVGGVWWVFAVLFLAPDLSALGYLVNARVGATCYNTLHTQVFPALLLALGVFARNPLAVSLALIWLAHIGLDRMVGFGLKYPTKFQDTHLQRV